MPRVFTSSARFYTAARSSSTLAGAQALSMVVEIQFIDGHFRKLYRHAARTISTPGSPTFCSPPLVLLRLPTSTPHAFPMYRDSVEIATGQPLTWLPTSLHWNLVQLLDQRSEGTLRLRLLCVQLVHLVEPCGPVDHPFCLLRHQLSLAGRTCRHTPSLSSDQLRNCTPKEVYNMQP